MSLAAARRAARETLADVRKREGFGHDLLAARLRRADLDPRDAALVTRIVYGTLATEGTLDEVLDEQVDRPARLHPRVRDALRAAVYELLYMRTPDRVAVHQGVESVREVNPRAAGLANAVLRRIAERADSFPWGDPATDDAALARLTGHPLWMTELLIADLGRARAEEVLRADLEPAPLYLAHNPFRGPLDALLARLAAEGAAPLLTGPEGCIEAADASAAVRAGALAAGECLVADAGAQFVASLCAPHGAGRVVDIAAGRGTKTALIQASAHRRGVTADVLAADLHGYKTSLLRSRMDELAVPGVTVVTADATDPASVELLGGPASADAVLVDAPCSGLGTLRRHPEKRWRVTPADIEALAGLGAAMLGIAARLVRPGGFVVYSTCTVTARENAEVVAGFLGSPEGEGFACAPLTAEMPGGWSHFLTDEGWFASYPTPGGPDGHFAALMRRTTDT